MRNFLIYLLMFFAVPTFGQNSKLDSIVADALRTVYADPDLKHPVLNLPTGKAYSWKRAGLTFGLGLVAGTAMGFHETSVHRPSAFPASWNQNWWNGQISWTNKYRNNDPAQGPAYFGSTTIFVAPTDAKHTFGTIHRAALLGTGVVIGFGEKRPLWQYGADLVAGFFGYSLGFGAIWDYRIYGK